LVGSTLATKNFIPSSTYGRRKGSAPGGIWYFSARSHPSRPAASLADRITIWYSPTVNCASIVTPKPSPFPPPPARPSSITPAGIAVVVIG
jgi:hypothetical protein